MSASNHHNTLSQPDQELVYAVEWGRADQIGGLVRRGADPNARTGRHSFTLHTAASKNFYHVIRELISHGANPDIRASDGHMTATYIAAANGHYRSLKALLEGGADPHLSVTLPQTHTRTSPVAIATLNNHPDCLRLLIQHGANINETDETGATLLHLAATLGHIEVARELIKQGASLNAKDINGNTPAGQAAIFQKTEIIWLLKLAGANLNIRNQNGRKASETPLPPPRSPIITEWLSIRQARRAKHLCQRHHVRRRSTRQSPAIRGL